MTQEFKNILLNINPTLFDNESVNLIENGVLDSLDLLNLITKLENHYNIKFEVNDMAANNFTSPETIWDIVNKLKMQRRRR